MGNPLEEIVSVSEYTSLIKQTLEVQIPPVWVRGEISNLRRQSSGHVYFSLKDSRSQLSSVLFRGDALRQTTQLSDGKQVLAWGNISVYEPRGNYQLIVRKIVDDGVGNLQKEFDALKNKLASEGLFNADRKRELPLLPKTIAIITSPTGAAVRDFISILKRRNWCGRLIVLPAKVQGDEALVDLLHMMKVAKGIKELDLLVVSRGGGSIEDLWPFNLEPFVRSIADFPIPVISAVGHEIDFTLSDFAADVRAETPSAAAELISSSYLDVLRRVESGAESLDDMVLGALQDGMASLDVTGKRLAALSPERQIEHLELKLDDTANRLASCARDVMVEKSDRLASLNTRLAAISPENYLKLSVLKFKNSGGRFVRSTDALLKSHAQALSGLEKQMKTLDMQNVLDRGYVVVRSDKGKILQRVSELREGEQLINQFADGRVKVRAEEIKKEAP